MSYNGSNTLQIDGKVVHVIWQPKYWEPRKGVWLLMQKMKAYDTEKNHDVYITFEKDFRYNFSGRVFLVVGGSFHILNDLELFHHNKTGFDYYLIPMEDLVEVFDMELPSQFLDRVEEYRSLCEED